MRISSSSKAVALLLLVSLQYSFAMVDVALCSKALCYPKTSGAKYGAVTKKCPDGFELGEDGGKAVCTKRVAKPCPEGSNLKDGKCCSDPGTSKQCVPMPGYTHFSCPAGFTAMRDCDSTGATDAAAAADDGGRKLLTIGNPLVKEINIKGTKVIPNVILPKPAISFNMAPPAAPTTSGPRFNAPPMQMPQIILPKPAISINVPAMQKSLLPEIKFEGSGIMPKVIPVLPEPKITIDIGAKQFAMNPFPTINTNITKKVVNVDLSAIGPKHTAEINLPAFPNIGQELMKGPDVDIKMPQLPKVIDLSALGPKKTVNLTLPEVKLPHPGSLTVKMGDRNEQPKFLDLTGVMNNITATLTGKTAEQVADAKSFNIVLPQLKTEGATVNVVVDGEYKDIVLGGPGGKHKTVINVPGWNKTDMPRKESKLTVDLSGATVGLNQKVDELNKLAKLKGVTNVDINMPTIDLTKLHNGMPDVVVDVQPLIKFNHSALGLSDQMPDTKLHIPGKPSEVRVNVTMQDVVLPKLMQDTTVVIKPKQFDVTKLLPHSLRNQSDDGSQVTTTTINLPEHTLPLLPVPGGKTDVDVSVPIKVGLLKALNPESKPDATLNIKYEEQWKGGNGQIPNPGASVANMLGKAVNAVTSAGCPTKCCKEVALAGGCQDQEFEVQTAPVQFECEAGCTYDLKNDKCLCSTGKVAACPAGLTKCSIGGKGVCAPDINGLLGMKACEAFKSVCGKVGVVAKTCQ